MIENQINMYMHCPRCLDELPPDITPARWAQLNVGVTDEGLQVWCVRHDINVMALDFHAQRVSFKFEAESDSTVVTAQGAPICRTCTRQ